MKTSAVTMLLSASLLLCGCQERLTTAQREPSFVITHQKTGRQAYDAAEVWIAQSFVSAKAVIEVRQPDNGLLIGNGSTEVEIRPAQFMAPAMVEQYRYSLKIANSDHSTVLSYEIEDRAYNTEAAVQILPGLRQASRKLAEALSGTVTAEHVQEFTPSK